MVIQELTTRECQDVLRGATIARLATARDNQPYVVPIHTYFDGDYLYSFATLGRKIDWMRANPKVCVEVEEVVDRFRWRTVLVMGRYEELVHTPHYEIFRERARELFHDRPEWWQPASTQTTRPDFRMPVIYRIRIDSMSGRLASRDEVRSEEGGSARPWWLSLMFEPVRDPKE
jgi:nitroimidazol reductase NimA-like FMN-containing flavoprotein (pyridoxamine 5'-phosphate oxidase superfamily)